MSDFYRYALALLGSTLLFSTANAATFTTVGDAVHVQYDGMVEGVPSGDLSAATYYELTGIEDGGSTWIFSGTLENTSAIDSRASIAGFSTSGLVDLSGSDASGGFSSVGAGAFSHGYSADFCVKNTGGANCAGGGGTGALTGAAPLAFTFSIHLEESVSELELLDFLVRYQSPGSLAQSTLVTFIPAAEVPLPATGWLMLSALAGLGLRLRPQRPTQV